MNARLGISVRGVAVISAALLVWFSSLRVSAQLSNEAYLQSMTGEWDGAPLVDGIPQDGTVLQDDILIPPPSKLLRAAGCGPNLWPNGIVPFLFHVSVSASNRLLVLEAMDLWMSANVGITFVPRVGQDDFILIVATNKNTSFVGRVGGNQILNLVNFGALYIVAHELSHALGFWHEQSRPDRSNFVDIINANVAVDQNQCGGSCLPNFAIQCWIPGSWDTPYDFLSIMHYGECHLSKGTNCPVDGTATIRCKPPYDSFQNQIGNRRQFGNYDVVDMQNVYGIGRSYFLDRLAVAPGNGTLARPWNPNQFAQAANSINSAGVSGTVWIRGGTYGASAGTYDQPGTFKLIPNTGPAVVQ